MPQTVAEALRTLNATSPAWGALPPPVARYPSATQSTPPRAAARATPPRANLDHCHVGAIVLDLRLSSLGDPAALDRVAADVVDPLVLARERGYAAMEQMLARAGAR